EVRRGERGAEVVDRARQIVLLAPQEAALRAQRRGAAGAHEEIGLRQGIALLPVGGERLDPDAHCRSGGRLALQDRARAGRGGRAAGLSRPPKFFRGGRGPGWPGPPAAPPPPRLDITPLVGREIGALVERRGKILGRARRVAELAPQEAALRPDLRARGPAC